MTGMRLLPFSTPLWTGFLAIFFLLGTSPVEAQSVDSLFAQARSVAFGEGDYEQARTLAYRALDRSPDYHGIRVFAARTWAWEGRRDTAHTELRYVLRRAPDHYEGLKAMIDVEMWSDRPQNALAYTDQALEHYPGDPHFLNKRARLLRWLNRPEAARSQLLSILELDPSNEAARSTLRQLRAEQRRYTATATYERNSFTSALAPWHVGSVSVSRSTPIGSVIGRVRYANRFATNGLQFEVDAYPSLASGLYAYLSAGASASAIFPGYRFGASLYKSLPWSLTAELGTRYLNFGGGGVFVHTASLTKYYGNYLIRTGTYVTPSGGSASVSVNGKVRRYLGGAQTYVGLSGSVGSAPSDPTFQDDLQRLRSWGVSVEGQAPVGDRTLVGGSLGYDFEEFSARSRGQVSVSLSLSYDF
jgi:YaiO family outer membrane protein